LCNENCFAATILANVAEKDAMGVLGFLSSCFEGQPLDLYKDKKFASIIGNVLLARKKTDKDPHTGRPLIELPGTI
jgi:hypothetical protein